MKSAEVYRNGNLIGVAVRENGKFVVMNRMFPDQSAAIDWLDNYHFDCDSLKIDTRSDWQIANDERYWAEINREDERRFEKERREKLNLLLTKEEKEKLWG